MKKEKITCNRAEKNGMWKGDKVKYRALHAWIKRNKPKPRFCEKCGKKTKKLELANISGKYKRDIQDYNWLCINCHRQLDGDKLWFDDKRKKIGIRFRNGKWEPRIKFRCKEIYLGRFKTKSEAIKARSIQIDKIRLIIKKERQ